MNSNVNPQDTLRDQIQMQPNEVDLIPDNFDGFGASLGWSGDGSGEDDLADLMATGDEGCCDFDE